MARQGMWSLSHIAGDAALFEAERQSRQLHSQQQQAQQQPQAQQKQQQQAQFMPPVHTQGMGQGGFNGGFAGPGSVGGAFAAGPLAAFPGGLGGPFDTMPLSMPLLPPHTPFGANTSLASSHANPRVAPGFTSHSQFGSLVVPSALGQLGTGAGPGGGMRAGGMACVGSAFYGLSLDAPDNRTSGNDSPDTSTEFEFTMGALGHLGGGVPQRGGAAHLAGAGPPSAPSAPSASPAVQDNVAMLKDMFPDIGHESIRQILHNCNGDIQEAANTLSDRPQAKASSNWSYAPSPQKVVAAPRHRTDNLYMDWAFGEVSYYLVIGYLGTGWAGFQFNDNIDTGQGALLCVLKDLDAVRSHKPDPNHTFTASRTDKGVHAVCLLLQIPMRQIKYGAESAFVKRVNSELQSRGAPHKNMHLFSVMMTPKELLDSRDRLNIRDWSCRINSNYLIYSRTYFYVIPTYLLSKLPGDVSKDTINTHMKKFKLSQQELANANSMFGAYVRRADFRAFTDPKRLDEYLGADAGGTEREVLRCGINHTFNSNGYEFALIEITGDRFMYHQIRLMMGLAFLSIQVDYTSEESIGAVLNGTKVPGQKFAKIPLAPAEPLLLRELNYKDDGMQGIAALLNNTKDQRDRFFNEKVLPHVLEKAPKPAAEFVNELHQTGGCAWKIKNTKS
jgi:tRNA pseudouridine(38-40) synthase